jgi:hypothetical protein
MERRFFLNVVIAERPIILELLSCKDETLLARRYVLPVPDPSLDVVDGVGWIHIERDGLAGENLDEDLYAVRRWGYWGPHLALHWCSRRSTSEISVVSVIELAVW